jgi:hypothetical protein
MQELLHSHHILIKYIDKICIFEGENYGLETRGDQVPATDLQ